MSRPADHPGKQVWSDQAAEILTWLPNVSACAAVDLFGIVALVAAKDPSSA